MRALFLCLQLVLFASPAFFQTVWSSDLDSRVRFYQTTDFGTILVGTERNLYAVDGETGMQIWRRATGRINETAVTPIPETDLILLSRDEGSKSRVEAVDQLSGARVWQCDKLKGDVLQLAVDPASDLLAVVLVKDTRGRAGGEFKRTPVVHVLQLSTGNELWKRQLDSDVQMMPARFGKDLGDVDYTLDNYRAPLLLDGRLFLFYDGATSYDARTGREKEREKFRINEDGLALTEADPVFNETHIFISGRGKIRAVGRQSGQTEWTAGDLGSASEMAVVGDTLYVRTGGQFTRLRDGEIVSRGPFGISAIDTGNGKTRWRYKGGDKGLTNFVFADPNTIVIADKNELMTIDARTGKRLLNEKHKIDQAQFVLINESGQAVVGGNDEIAAFFLRNSVTAGKSFRAQAPAEAWRVRHKAPARGVFRIIGGIALRATALYFRYGGVATSAFSLARVGMSAASAINSFRWSGLRSRFGSFDLTTLASSSARNYAVGRIYAYGSIARLPGIADRIGGLRIERPGLGTLGRIAPSRSDVQESVIDRLDPVRQVEKLSDLLLRKKRLAELRGNYMYFYTDLPKPFDRKGLAGVNVHNGRSQRFIFASDPDPQFLIDEAADLLYSADGDKIHAFKITAQ